MRKNWLLIGIGLLVGVLAIAAIGCGDDDGPRPSPPSPTPSSDGGDDDDGGDATTLTAALTEVDGSGVTGTATLTEFGDEATQVMVEMAGLSGSHANHLHHGTCDAQGRVDVPLIELQAPKGTTHTTLGLAHFEAGHYVAVHEAGGAPGPVISCGNVE